MHLQYKAQTQARDLAERAPDLNSIGGLYDPSNPHKLKPIRPTIRTDSAMESRPTVTPVAVTTPAAIEQPQVIRPTGPRPDYRVCLLHL